MMLLYFTFATFLKRILLQRVHAWKKVDSDGYIVWSGRIYFRM